MTTNKKLDRTILEIIQGTRFRIVEYSDIDYELFYNYDIVVPKKRVMRSLNRLTKKGKLDIRFTTIDNELK